MAEDDFTPLYQTGPVYRPAYASRQFGAGYRAPGFIGRGLSQFQPQTAATQGAQSSADANAALRGLYAARADEGGFGVGEGRGAISGGQQRDVREARDLTDLGVSIAKGLGMMSGPVGFGSGMYSAAQRRDQVTPYTVRDLVPEYLAGVFGSSDEVGQVEGNPAAPPNADRFGSADESENSDLMSAGAAADLGFGASSPEPSGAELDTYAAGGMIGRPGDRPMPRPVMAHTGEFVQRPAAVNKYGVTAMHAINSLRASPKAIKKATAPKTPARDALKALRARR